MLMRLLFLVTILALFACKKRSSETNSIFAVADQYVDSLCVPNEGPEYIAYSLFVPNSFTPNGDGLNDIFQPKGKGISSYNLRIFNNSNVLIYQSVDIFKGWNATASGTTSKVSAGIYKFTITTKETCRGIEHYYTGNISIIP
jgi:gliding motility-associated-like protein